MDEYEADPLSMQDILVLRAMAEKLEEALVLAEAHGAEQLVGLLRQTKTWVDATLARNPSSVRN